jgi:hypothetical protein
MMPLYLSRSSTRVFPWAALILLVSAYIMLGLFLAELSIGWVNWVLAIVGVLLVTVVFTLPQFDVERQISKWLRSDTSAFILLIVSAALVSVILLWLHVFLKIIAILATEVLIRLELRRNNYKVAQSFWLLVSISWLGLALGWFISHFI